MSNLTKDADKTLCIIYKEYLSRRKNNISKSEASNFEISDIETLFNDFDINDIYLDLQELSKNQLIKSFISGEFILNSNAIVYMENRFRNGLAEVVDFISKLIP